MIKDAALTNGGDGEVEGSLAGWGVGQDGEPLSGLRTPVPVTRLGRELEHTTGLESKNKETLTNLVKLSKT